MSISASVHGLEKDNVTFTGTSVANSLIKCAFDFKISFDVSMVELAVLVVRLDAKIGVSVFF